MSRKIHGLDSDTMVIVREAPRVPHVMTWSQFLSSQKLTGIHAKMIGETLAEVNSYGDPANWTIERCGKFVIPVRCYARDLRAIGLNHAVPDEMPDDAAVEVHTGDPAPAITSRTVQVQLVFRHADMTEENADRFLLAGSQ